MCSRIRIMLNVLNVSVNNKTHLDVAGTDLTFTNQLGAQKSVNRVDNLKLKCSL